MERRRGLGARVRPPGEGPPRGRCPPRLAGVEGHERNLPPLSAGKHPVFVCQPLSCSVVGASRVRAAPSLPSLCPPLPPSPLISARAKPRGGLTAAFMV